MDEPKKAKLTKRQFLRKVVVGSGTVAFVAGEYKKPELETLIGARVAHASGSGYYPRGGRRRGGDD